MTKYILLIIIILGLAYQMKTNQDQREKISSPQKLYKVLSPDSWKRSQSKNYIERGPLDTDFIHLATKEQLASIIEKFWKDKEHIVITLDTRLLEGDLRFESNPGGKNKYYHLYNGDIPLKSVKP